MRVIVRLPLVLLILLVAADAGLAQGVRFGGAIAVDTDLAVVGEVANALRPGTVYVYRRNAATWEEAATLTAPDAAVRDGFGAPLALADSTLFVGQKKAVHVFTADDDGSWELGSTITAPDDRDGRALAATAEWLFVGVPGVRPSGYGRRESQGSPSPGSVGVYRRGPDGEWTEHAQLAAPESAGGDRFGAAIVVHDDLALIGAPGSSEQLGTAYVYRLDAASGEWREAARLQAGSPEEDDDFGAAVALGPDIAVVGAPGSANGGAAFVFRRDAADDAWTEDVRLTSFAGSGNGRFGTAVAVAGDEVWVGAPSAGLNTGSAYVFRADAETSSLSTARLVELNETQPSDRFGDVVALADGVAAIAATGMDHRAGTVFVYAADDAGAWREEAVLESENEALAMHSGEALECADGGKIDLFECGNVELLSFLPVSELTLPGENRGSRTNDVWGWLDEETGREYAIVGRIDVSEPLSPREVGFLDTAPYLPQEPGFSGTWSNYPFFESGAIAVASVHEGLFLVRYRAGEPVLDD